MPHSRRPVTILWKEHKPMALLNRVYVLVTLFWHKYGLKIDNSDRKRKDYRGSVPSRPRNGKGES